MSEKMPFGAENDPSKIEATEATKKEFLDLITKITEKGVLIKDPFGYSKMERKIETETESVVLDHYLSYSKEDEMVESPHDILAGVEWVDAKKKIEVEVLETYNLKRDGSMEYLITTLSQDDPAKTIKEIMIEDHDAMEASEKMQREMGFTKVTEEELNALIERIRKVAGRE